MVRADSCVGAILQPLALPVVQVAEDALSLTRQQASGRVEARPTAGSDPVFPNLEGLGTDRSGFFRFM